MCGCFTNSPQHMCTHRGHFRVRVICPATGPDYAHTFLKRTRRCHSSKPVGAVWTFQRFCFSKKQTESILMEAMVGWTLLLTSYTSTAFLREDNIGAKAHYGLTWLSSHCTSPMQWPYFCSTNVVDMALCFAPAIKWNSKKSYMCAEGISWCGVPSFEDLKSGLPLMDLYFFYTFILFILHSPDKIYILLPWS